MSAGKQNPEWDQPHTELVVTGVYEGYPGTSEVLRYPRVWGLEAL